MGTSKIFLFIYLLPFSPSLVFVHSHSYSLYHREYPIARAFADARVQRIYGGANEIMKAREGRIGPFLGWRGRLLKERKLRELIGLSSFMVVWNQGNKAEFCGK